MDEIIIVESKDYSQVVFDEMKECYKEDVEIECFFTMNELLKPNQTDFIGIYKVGFIHSKDYYTYQIIDLHEINENNKGKIIFPARNLPKDDGEFYQFVYVSQAKQIRGASIPFQFRRSHLSDYVQVDEPEAVVIKTKELELNEVINQIKSKCNNLTEANNTYEKVLKENEEIIKVLKNEISDIKLKYVHVLSENDKLNSVLKLKCDSLKNINDSINTITNENTILKEKFEVLSNENRHIGDLLQRRINQVESLKTELDSFKTRKEELEMILNLKEAELIQLRKDKEELIRISDDLQKINDQISKLENQVDERVADLSNMKIDLKKNEKLLFDQTQTIQEILNERDSLHLIVEKITKEKDELETSRNIISQELSMSKDKLLAAEQSKELLRSQLSVISNELEVAVINNKKYCEKLELLEENEKKYVKENENLVEEINKIKIDYYTKLEESNGSYFALNLANNHLESRIKIIQQKNDKELEEFKKEIETLKFENENLKQRIRAGAYEFANLNKKYLKLKNLFYNNKNFNFKTESFIKENEDFSNKDKTISESPNSEYVISANSNDSLLIEGYLNSSFNSNFQKNNLEKPDFNPLDKLDIYLNTNEDNLNKTDGEKKINASFNDSGFKNSPNKTTRSHFLSPTSNNLDKNRNEYCINEEYPKNETKNCDICGYIFPTDINSFSYENHMSSHYGPSCPICFLTFRKGYPQIDFENHVNSHFTN